jgi:uncharacterized lipoprotein
MLRALFAASLVALLAGCASIPAPSKPQVNRAMKADKYAAPKKPVVVEAATPNGVVKKRWSWPHPSWLSK